MLGAIAIVMGLQAASVSKFGATTLQTVVITGPIVRLAEGLVDLLWPGKRAGARAAADASAHNGLAWIAYGAGGALGATGVVFRAGSRCFWRCRLCCCWRRRPNWPSNRKDAERAKPAGLHHTFFMES